MASLFGFGPFSSPIGQLIARSTENAASAGDLHLHLEICDMINESTDGPKEAAAALKKRFSGAGKNFHVVNLTLTVLETCVKNCGNRFHIKIAQKDFLAELVKIVNPKNSPPPLVRDRILGLIQSWADAFRGKPDLQAVVDVYDQLKDEGREFPPLDLDALAPINTPTRRIPEQDPATSVPHSQQIQLQRPSQGADESSDAPDQPQEAPPPAQQPPRRAMSETQIAKSLSELDVMRANIAVLNEMMAEIEPGTQTAGEQDLMSQLSTMLKETQRRIVALCERIRDDVLLATLLAGNDEVNGVLIRYDRFVKNSGATEAGVGVALTEPLPPTQQTAPVVSQETPLQPPPAYPDLSEMTAGGDEPLLIDLGDEVTVPTTSQIDELEQALASAGVSTEGPPPAATAPPQAGVDDDADFDMFAQTRQMAYTVQSDSAYADQKADTSGSLAAAIQKNKTTEEDSVKALQDWLSFGTEDTTGQPVSAGGMQSGETATSAEFEQFLALRAQEGSSLKPTRPRPQMQNPEDEEGPFAL